MGRSYLIGQAGDSACGKATFTKGIKSLLGEDKVTWISEDDYHRYDRTERKARKVTPLVPEANALDLLARHYEMLRAGETILKPVYDHTKGTFDRPILLKPTPVVVLTGLLPFYNDELRDRLDLALFLDTVPDLKRAWKINRDVAQRGYRLDDLLADMAGRVPDFRAYVEPQKMIADIVVTQEADGNETRVKTRTSIRIDRAVSLADYIKPQGTTVRVERWGHEDQTREIIEASAEVDFDEVAELCALVPNPPARDKINGSIVGQLCVAAQVALGGVLDKVASEDELQGVV